jgi:hypothetical protein
MEYAPGKGAEVEADHQGGDPAAGAIDDGLLIHVSRPAGRLICPLWMSPVVKVEATPTRDNGPTG